jgi:hypothetical protein
VALRWLRDVAEASWIAERLHPFGEDAGSVVPDGFERYARLFHPVEGRGGRYERWTEIAERNGRIVHPEMQLHMISRPVGTPSLGGYDPGPGYNSGSLPKNERVVVVEHLRRATRTPDDCWFCVWEGFGGMDDQGVDERVELSARSYLLARGSIDEALPSVLDAPWDQSPNLSWPSDRSWFVVTEIDYAWTYVAGSHALIEALLDEPRLEVLPALLSHKPFYDSDVLNAALDA